MDNYFIETLRIYSMAAKDLGLVKVVEINCGSCFKILKIPMGVYFAVELARGVSDGTVLGKIYEGFYISREPNLIGRSGFYCNKSCHIFFTED